MRLTNGRNRPVVVASRIAGGGMENRLIMRPFQEKLHLTGRSVSCAFIGTFRTFCKNIMEARPWKTFSNTAAITRLVRIHATYLIKAEISPIIFNTHLDGWSKVLKRGGSLFRMSGLAIFCEQSISMKIWFLEVRFRPKRFFLAQRKTSDQRERHMTEGE